MSLRERTRPELGIIEHEAQGGGELGGAPKKEGGRSGLQMLPSVIALPPSIDVPRTMTIGLTDAALHCPIRRTSIPSPVAATVVAVMVIVGTRIITVTVLRLYGGGRSDCGCADEAQRNSHFC